MVEIKRILCPVDLSDASRHALDHARALARWYDADVTVLHVYDLPQPVVAAAGLAAAYPPSLLPQPHEIADEVRQFYGIDSGLKETRVRVSVVEGSPVKQIVDHAESLPADLLVLGTHGRSGFEQLFLGSVTEKVLRSTRAPVLTVPPPVQRVETVIFKTILCAIDFSDASMRALEYALVLAEETDARLILLHVVEALADESRFSEISAFTVPEYYRQLQAEAVARLKGVIPEDARVWCTPEERVVPGKPYRIILQTGEEVNADIIVIGVHGRGALNRLLFGSTTHHVIREARCPVLTLRD